MDLTPSPTQRRIGVEGMRRRILPSLLYGALGLFVTGGIGTGASALATGVTSVAVLSVTYLCGAAFLAAAVRQMHRGRTGSATRIAALTWMVTSCIVALVGDLDVVVALTPVSLALVIMLAAMFDARAVLAWGVGTAVAWVVTAAVRVLIDPAAAEALAGRVIVIALLPASMLILVAWGVRAAVQLRTIALSHATRAQDHAERVAAHLSEANDDLRQANEDLRRARVDLREQVDANEAKGLFLANMSHELRTPLNAIIGYGEMVREELEDQDEHELVGDMKRIEGAGRHLLQLINDILDLSKIESGSLHLHTIDFALPSLLKDLVATVQPSAGAKGLKLQLVSEDDLDWVHGDDTRVRQILLNLLGNAVKFTSEGTIVVSAWREGGAVAFSVADPGIGMSEEQLARVFQPFEQAEVSTTRQFGGTGLGLSITQRLCAMMDGSIGVESEPGVGSTFTVRLALPSADQTPGAVTPPPSPGPGPLVLVVDDDPDARRLISTTLQGRGYRVAEAASGEPALALARELRPVAITLDVLMPGIDGWAVLEQLKADAELASIPVVLVTFLRSPQRGFALGAADYLVKPVDRERLLATLERLAVDREPPVLVVDDEEANRAILTRALRSGGWHTETACNGREALEALAQTRPAAIVLDLLMPEMDGLTFLQHLRNDPGLRAVPVIVVTSKDLDLDERIRLKEAAQGVFQRGELSTDELLQDLAAAVQAAAGRRAPR